MPTTTPSRRALFATTALVPLAACSLFTPANVATVEQVIAKIQAVMPYVSGIVSVVGLVVPGVTSVVNGIEAGLTAESTVFANLTSTMTAAAAQPLVGQIATYLKSALTNARTVIAALPASAQTQANNLLAEANTVLTDIQAFATGATATAPTVTAAMFVPPVPVHLFVRPVK